MANLYYFQGLEIVTPFQIRSNQPVFDNDTLSLKKQRASQGAQRWELSFSVITDDPADLLIGVLDGQTTTQTMPMPQLTSVQNRIDGGTALPKGAFVMGNTDGKIYVIRVDGMATPSTDLYPTPTISQTYSTPADAVLTYYVDVNRLVGIQYSDGVLADAGQITVIEAL